MFQVLLAKINKDDGKYSVITYKGKESKKEYTVNMESLCCIPETNATL